MSSAALLFFLCAASASAQELWSNPGTWGGQVPGPGAHVVIPQARRIILDVSPPPLGSITVHGDSRFNSIWTSFHRAIAVHQTAGVEVRGNVAADIWSHAAWRPATFWINNAKNVVRRNRAAGGLDAIGF